MSVPNGTVDPQGTDGTPSEQSQGKQVTHSPVEALTTVIDSSVQSSSIHPDFTPTDTSYE